MGIADWLLGLGVRAEQTAEHIATRQGKVPLQWPAGQPGSLIYRLPRDPAARASLFSTIQTIVVNEGEMAVVLEDGRSAGALEPGRYVFQKARVVGALDIVWMKTGQVPLKWGIGNVASFDGIQISANGMAYLRVIHGDRFNAEVIQGGVQLAEVELQRFLMPRMQGVVRSTLAQFQALDLQVQRDVFSTSVRDSLNTTFDKMGIGIVDFEVIEVNFPPEFKAVIAQAAMATHGGKAQLIEAQTQAQITQLQALADANAQLTSGMAQAQVMAQLQAQGIDPLKLKAMEALNTMAANPVQGAVMGGDTARAALFGQIAGAALVQGTPVAAQVPGVLPPAQLPGQLPAPAAPPAAAPAAPPQATPAAPAAGPSVDDLERQLDNLMERLSEGKITEATFNKLSSRIEGKIAKLTGG